MLVPSPELPGLHQVQAVLRQDEEILRRADRAAQAAAAGGQPQGLHGRVPHRDEHTLHHTTFFSLFQRIKTTIIG